MLHPAARLLALLVVSAALAGCGGSGAGRPNSDATLLLDFQPNAVHTGIYQATQRGYDEAEGVDLTIQVPGDSTDAVKLLATRRIQYAVMDIHDLALAREKGQDLVAVMALVQRPLAAVLAKPSITSPKQLVGKRVGVTGLPSDDAVVDSEVRGAGGDPSKVRKTTIGFTAVRSLLAGKVDAATAFWNVEGLALKRERPGFKEFRVDDFGAPAYPELVLVTQRETIQDDRRTVQAVVTALRRGYREAILAPEEAVGALVDAVDGADRATTQEEFDAVGDLFGDTDAEIGRLDRPELDKWADWEVRFGIVEKKPDVALMFDPSFDTGTISG